MKNETSIIVIFGIILAATSVVFVFMAPKMHKQFQFSVIEYFIKFNSDNTTTTIKKTTDYGIKKEEK